MSHSYEHHLVDHGEHGVKGSEVFVGGLPCTVTEDKIHEVLSTCGEITEIRLIKDQKGNSKGFGFVKFTTKEAADKAVKEKSGFMLDGKQIGVLPSANQDTLFFGNLDKGWNASDFDKIVRQVFPDVVSVDLAMPLTSSEAKVGQKQKNRGFAFVKFSSHAAAARAYRLGSKSDFLLCGNLHPNVQWAEEEPEVDPNELAKIKIAFVRNLPTDCNEVYLKKLFEPLGKVDKVVVSRKGKCPVGFVHFDKRSDLDNAIKEMNEKTVQGPKGGASFKLSVEVARPFDKKRKRAYEDPQDLSSGKSLSQPKLLKDDLTINPSGLQKSKSQKEPVFADSYEVAVVSLPVVVKERLLRILRLGIATRFDIDIHCLSSLQELPESTAISILDQFMLSGADKPDKGAYLAGLISRHQNDKLGLYELPSSLPRVGDIPTREAELPSLSGGIHPSPGLSGRIHPSPGLSGRIHPSPGLSGRTHLSPIDSVASEVGMTADRSYNYLSRYSTAFPDYPLSTFGRLEKTSSIPLQQATGPSTFYSRIKLDSSLSAAADHQTLRPHVRFDPFTGEPYKFDPFTGEPIRPEILPRRFGSPY